MIRKAIPLDFKSGWRSGISSKTVNKVLADRQQKIMKSPKQTSSPAYLATADPCETKWPMVMATIPDIPPEASAVFAFKPIKIH